MDRRRRIADEWILEGRRWGWLPAAARCVSVRGPVSRVLSRTPEGVPRRPFIWDACRHAPRAAYPDAARATPSRPYLALLRVGFSRPACRQAAGALLPHHFTLACGPCGPIGGVFLCHFPSGRPAFALRSTLPCGARTFLDARMDAAAARPPHSRILSSLPEQIHRFPGTKTAFGDRDGGGASRPA